MPLPSPTPPAPITGISIASATCGIKVIEVDSPIWPPDSHPSAITASTPVLSNLLAIATEAITGITVIPASFHISIYFSGFPAPVVTTGTFSSTTTFATSSADGLRSITFTPKGLSVNSLVFLISSLTTSAGAFAAPIIPSPPAFDTAAAK